MTLNKDEFVSSLTHFVGFLLSIVALVLLIVFAAHRGTAIHVVAFSIFGASLILLYAISSAYHFIHPYNKAKKILRKIDHSMIYVLIAGTYTPIVLVALKGGLGWSIFGVIWGLAIMGIMLKTLVPISRVRAWHSVLFYILMGWLIVFAFFPLNEAISSTGFLWLLLGGVMYTLGTIFFGLDIVLPRKRWFRMHDIFHLFILAGSFSHFWLMFRYIMYL